MQRVSFSCNTSFPCNFVMPLGERRGHTGELVPPVRHIAALAALHFRRNAMCRKWGPGLLPRVSCGGRIARRSARLTQGVRNRNRNLGGLTEIGAILHLPATAAQFAVFAGWGSVMRRHRQSRHTGANRGQRWRYHCPLTVLTAKTASFGGLFLPSYRHCRHSREKILAVRMCDFQNSKCRFY